MLIGHPKFVLASGSPRQLMLVNQVGIEPDALRPADIDEMPIKGELPSACSNRLARAKAETALAAVKLDDGTDAAPISSLPIRWWRSAAASCRRPNCSMRPRNACGFFRAANIASTPRSAW